MCGSSARTDLYGGRPAMSVPTVTGVITIHTAHISEFHRRLLRLALQYLSLQYPEFLYQARRKRRCR